MTLDLEPMVRTLKVRDKRKRLIPFEPNWAQKQILRQVKEDYEAGKPTRIICLKARQIGISTITEAIIFCKSVLFPSSVATIGSLDTDQAVYLFDMFKCFHEEWEFSDLYQTEKSSRRELVFEDIKSSIIVKTGENPKAFRGRTYTDAHISEVAFWTKPVEAMLAIEQGFPFVRGNFEMVESTANGIGNWFEEEWKKAEEGKSDYTPFFFPWFMHYEYLPCSGEGCHDGTCPECSEASKHVKPKDSEERELLKMGATKAHLVWRRWAIVNKCFNNLDLFHQEYPATPREAFLASGVNAFNLDDLDAVFQEEEGDVGRFVVSGGEVKFITDPDGPWTVFRHPAKDEIAGQKWGEYFIGADPCYGSFDGDFAAAQVISRRTKEQVAVFHGRIHPEPFADELALAGKYFNLAVIAPETEGGGIGTIARLRTIYPKLYQRRSFDVVPGQDRSERQLGWSTNWKTKAELITKGSEMVMRGQVSIHHRKTYTEMKNYSFYSGKGYNDKFGPADEERGRDDLVMSWCIAIVCEDQESPLTNYEVAEPNGVTWARENEEEEEW